MLKRFTENAVKKEHFQTVLRVQSVKVLYLNVKNIIVLFRTSYNADPTRTRT